MALAQIESVWDKADQSPVQDLLNSTHADPALNQMLQEARNDPAIWHAHILPLHQRLRQQMGLKEASPPPKAQSSRILYYHSDHLGTPRELTDSQGNIVWAATYKAWGATQRIDYPPTLQTVQNGNTVQAQWIAQSRYDRPIQNLRFQGQYFDQETGLHYNRFRYYDPDIGRFISQDPIGLYGGDNLYQYAPNPTGWIDPWGLASIAHLRKGSTLCITDKFPIGSAESKELKEFVSRWNEQIKNRGGSMTRRILSQKERKDSEKWRRQMRCKCPPGRVAGHVPDAAAGGPAIPLDWMPQFAATNGYIGGIVKNLPVGYNYDNVKLVASLTNC